MKKKYFLQKKIMKKNSFYEKKFLQKKFFLRQTFFLQQIFLLKVIPSILAQVGEAAKLISPKVLFDFSITKIYEKKYFLQKKNL